MTRARRRDNRWFTVRDRGAALLTVLVLVAFMAVLAATMLDRLNLATRLAANGQAMAQARLYALSAENIVAARLGAMVAIDRRVTVDRAGLLDRQTVLPLARGTVAVTVRDAGNCFNVNALVEGEDGQYRLRLGALLQLRRLMDGLGIDQGETAVVTDALVDWIDSDQVSLPNGAEDDYYLSQDVPYRTSGRLIADVSELRAIRGMREPTYRILAPWLCALPSNADAVLNLNTLRPDQARLVAAMPVIAPEPGLIRSIIEARPASGWRAIDQAIGPLAGAGGTFGPGQLRQLAVSSRWFEARLVARVDAITLEERALIDARLEPARVVNRSWGESL